MPSTTRMEELIQSFCVQATGGLSWLLWPEAEDRALRGRNLSAVFRTLYRQGRKFSFLSCAQPWRVENQCDKSALRMSQQHRLFRTRETKNSFLRTLKKVLTKKSNRVSIFPGQAHRAVVQARPSLSRRVQASRGNL